MLIEREREREGEREGGREREQKKNKTDQIRSAISYSSIHSFVLFSFSYLLVQATLSDESLLLHPCTVLDHLTLVKVISFLSLLLTSYFFSSLLSSPLLFSSLLLSSLLFRGLT